MKLYILTSTLNFHSIMATGSCSPLACYAQRGFGDSYFYKAGSFAKNNSIILFSKYPKCVMSVTEEEQYSLVIEIDTEKTAYFEFEEIDRHNDVVIYQTNRTIYINPMGCKLLFESNDICKLILSRAKVRSLDAKMLFYSKAGSFTVPHTESFTYSSKEYIEPYSDVEFDEGNLAQDRKINKCKGFLYAYLIGANTSPGKGASKMQRILKELSNLVHARIINNDFSLHTDRINELQKQFETEARKYDTVTKELSESANRLNSSTTEMLQNELVRLGVWDALACKMFTLPNLSFIYSSEQWDGVEMKMTQFIASVSSAANNRLIVDEIPAIHEYEPPVVLLRASNQETGIYTSWIKFLLNPECNLKEYFANKLSFLKSLGIAAKGIIGDEAFAISQERDYYNGLIKNIREAEDFDLSFLNSTVWQSLAICAKVTNPDIDALYSLMTSYAVEDYRCAVAMWGAMCGYADMPKTFFNRIIEGVSVQDAYEYSRCIEKRIHGFQGEALVTKIPPTLPPIKPVLPPESIEQHSLEDIVHNHLKEYEKENGKKLPKPYRESVEKALAGISDGTVINFLSELKTLKGFTKVTKTSFWTYIKDKICPEYDEITNAKSVKKNLKKKQETPGLFDQMMDNAGDIKSVSPGSDKSINRYSTVPTSKLFVDDKNARVYINSCSYLPIQIRDILYQKVTSFQQDYAPNGYYCRNPRTNDNTIKHFINKCTFIKGDNTSWIPPTAENKNLLERLKQELYDRYADR